MTWFLRDEVHLLNISVEPARRRRGVGAALVSHLLDVAYSERRRSVSLEVRASNTGAMQLYEGFGFVKIGVRKRYYEDNQEDAVIMLKDIEAAGGSMGLAGDDA